MYGLLGGVFIAGKEVPCLFLLSINVNTPTFFIEIETIFTNLFNVCISTGIKSCAQNRIFSRAFYFLDCI